MTSISVPVHAIELTGSRPAEPAKKNRYLELDLLKAIAILVVILIHSLQDLPKTNRSVSAVLLLDITRFAVPWFLFVSGFLFPKTKVAPSAELLRKLAFRILPAYWICSIAWLCYYSWSGQHYDWEIVLKSLVYAESHGTYYFVFVISYLYVLGASMRYWRRGAIYGLWGASVGLLIGFYVTMPYLALPDFSYRAMLRSPCVHLLPFVTGWVTSLHYDRLREFYQNCSPRVLWLMAALAIVSIEVANIVPREIRSRELLVHAYVMVLLFLMLGIGIRTQYSNRVIQWLSHSSYAIYLTHIAFITIIHRMFRAQELFDMPGRVVLTWVVTTIASVAAIYLLQKALGQHSRILLGA